MEGEHLGAGVEGHGQGAQNRRLREGGVRREAQFDKIDVQDDIVFRLKIKGDRAPLSKAGFSGSYPTATCVAPRCRVPTETGHSRLDQGQKAS